MLETQSKSMRFLKEWVIPFIIALGLFILINLFVSFAKVHGMSMFPTYSPDSFVVINRCSYWNKAPEAGDIVVFYTDLDNGESVLGGKKKLIKRVIANEGDHVVIKNGEVYVNEVKLNEDYLADGIYTDGNIDITLDSGYCFALGDNRPVSHDSRYEDIGPISYDDIMGKVVLNFF